MAEKMRRKEDKQKKKKEITAQLALDSKGYQGDERWHEFISVGQA